MGHTNYNSGAPCDCRAASEQYWIEREYGDRISGPYSTKDDALQARVWVERVKYPETFWVRSDAEHDAQAEVSS